jgi:osmoprotectant transport system permease protein
MNQFWNFLLSHATELQAKLVEHIAISLSAMVIAILVGVNLGILITRIPRLKTPILGMTNIFQTIPSIALLGFLIPFVGIGLPPTLIALIVYALLPITSNTFTGIKGVPSSYLKVARSLGFTPWQRLRLIEFPLALPVIMSGIRTSMAMTIGITTIAAFIGAGGLGDFITQGLSLNDPNLILLGAIPSAVLALTIDYVLATLTVLSSRRKRLTMRFKVVKMVFLAGVVILLASITLHQVFSLNASPKKSIVIGTKNFTEQYILGHLMAELIEAKTDLKVIQKFNLGTTAILQNALLAKQVDLYPEYTGTAYVVILKQTNVMSPQQTFDFVQKAYQEKFHLKWLQPFGFENSESLAVKKSFANQHDLSNLSDLKGISDQLIVAAPAEFYSRPDGLPGLMHTYGLTFKKIVQVQPDLVYPAINNGNVQAIVAFTTDGRIAEFNLRILNDNLHFYPPYYAAPVIREDIDMLYPEIASALRPLLGTIDNQTMRLLNYEVDVKKRSPREVARDYLRQCNML